MRALRAILYELFFLGLFLGVLPVLLRRLDLMLPRLPLDPLRPFGVLLLAAGFLLSEYCLALLVRRGRGLQAPFDHPRILVAAGPYRRTRNPMALGFLLMLLGAALLLSSTAVLLYALFSGAAVHALIVWREEPALRRRFAARWDRYARRVPRWVPRVH